MITFKKFAEWANARACDGQWTAYEAIESATICSKYYKYPRFLREYIWKHSTEGDRMDSLYISWRNEHLKENNIL